MSLAGPDGPKLDEARLDRAFDVVGAQVADGRTTYAALAVARGDGLVRAEAYHRDGPLETVPRTAIASLTKPITSTAILQLAEAGALVLAEPISSYIPEFAPSASARAPDPTPTAITVSHVLTHTAGLTDAPDDFLMQGIPTPASMLERVCGDPLRFGTGSAYAYTSDSFYLLSALIERRSGMEYGEYLRRHIFEPLDMTATTFDPTEPGPPSLPLEGQPGPAGVPHELAVATFISLSMPGGGLWSTPEDIVRFGRAMLNGGSLDGARIIGRPFLELAVRDHTANVAELGTGRSPHYGLGWGLTGLDLSLPASPSAFGHAGATGSYLLIDPLYDLVVVYLRNEWGVASTATHEALQAVYGAL